MHRGLSKYQIRGLTNESGDLETYMESLRDIWVAPVVTFTKNNLGRNKSNSRSWRLDQLWYTEVVTSTREHLIEDCINYSIDPNYESGDRFEQFDPLKAGWYKKDDTDNALTDFLRLVQRDADVLSFARKWGPLWYCPGHDACLTGVFAGQRNSDSGGCLWVCSEPISAFLVEARRAEAAMDIVSCIWGDAPHSAPGNYWDTFIAYSSKNHLNYSFVSEQKDTRFEHWLTLREQERLTAQRKYLTAVFNLFLNNAYSVRFQVDVSKSGYADLKIHQGLGVLSAVWLQIIQVATGKCNICICDGCNSMYQRVQRKPQKGRLNFCSNCGLKASKRIYGQRRKYRS